MRAAAEDAYAQAGVTDPRRQLAMAEVHDCFTPTELVLMEDLGFAARGTAWKEVLYFAVFMSVLLIRPAGLFGQRGAEQLGEVR